VIKFILGSSSKARLELLKKINFNPDLIVSPNIDESPIKKEKPLDYVRRMAMVKCETLHKNYFGNNILSADTIVTYQRKIIQKANTIEEVEKLLKSYSNKSIKVVTSVYLITSNNNRVTKTVETSIKFKSLNKIDIDEYIQTGIGIGKAGGIAIESIMDSFIKKIIGSYSNIIGLPLYETRNILISSGVGIK